MVHNDVLIRQLEKSLVIYIFILLSSKLRWINLILTPLLLSSMYHIFHYIFSLTSLTISLSSLFILSLATLLLLSRFLFHLSHYCPLISFSLSSLSQLSLSLILYSLVSYLSRYFFSLHFLFHLFNFSPFSFSLIYNYSFSLISHSLSFLCLLFLSHPLFSHISFSLISLSLSFLCLLFLSLIPYFLTFVFLSYLSLLFFCHVFRYSFFLIPFSVIFIYLFSFSLSSLIPSYYHSSFSLFTFSLISLFFSHFLIRTLLKEAKPVIRLSEWDSKNCLCVELDYFLIKTNLNMWERILILSESTPQLTSNSLDETKAKIEELTCYDSTLLTGKNVNKWPRRI